MDDKTNAMVPANHSHFSSRLNSQDIYNSSIIYHQQVFIIIIHTTLWSPIDVFNDIKTNRVSKWLISYILRAWLRSYLNSTIIWSKFPSDIIRTGRKKRGKFHKTCYVLNFTVNQRLGFQPIVSKTSCMVDLLQKKVYIEKHLICKLLTKGKWIVDVKECIHKPRKINQSLKENRITWRNKTKTIRKQNTTAIIM